MKLKKTGKKIWKGLTSQKTKDNYKKTINAMSKLGAGTANYFERANRSLDRVVGTHDPGPGRLTGVALPKGYKLVKIRTKSRKRKRR